MTANHSPKNAAPGKRTLLLGVDTCGPSGSVALGQLEGDALRILGQTELAGGSYSATLVSAVADLLLQHSAALLDLHAIVVVSGPGSFTGVRVGLSAVKGLAEPATIPVIAVSRLKVMAASSASPFAALDAHRHEVFLRLNESGMEARELLAGAAELKEIHTTPALIAVCDDAAAELLKSAWPNTELVRTGAPTAADAMRVSLQRILAGEFADLALLDGHYLRRSDAEIFGESKAQA
jgi:tRNA threonylcarbamoyladenosine biosynthesis protein TsaB